jgi:hypothetical protein
MEEHRPKKPLDQVRDAIRLKHYSYRTEQAYVGWIMRYIYFHNVRHPSEMGAPEVEAYLTHLAVKEHVAASTQNQALSALLFLYREVLHHRNEDAYVPLTAEALLEIARLLRANTISELVDFGACSLSRPAV